MKRLAGLDALRGIAALLVVIGHTSPQMGLTFGKLYLAVDFFFMLSGYVMSRTYEERMAEGGSISFLKARIRRLWPMMAFGTLLSLPLLGQVCHSAWLLLAGLLFIPLFGGGLAYPLNGPAWSIFDELFANLAHALGLYRLSTEALAWLVGSLFIVLTVIATMTGTIHWGQEGNGFLLGLPRVLFSYLFGVILYRKWEDEPPIYVNPAITLMAMPALMLPPIRTPILDLLFVGLICPIVIAGGIRMRPSRLLMFSGAMSFPLYATHIPVRHLYLSAEIGWPAGLAISLAMAALLVEAPKLRLLSWSVWPIRERDPT